MRIVFQGYSIYSAVICCILIGGLAFEFAESTTEGIAKMSINLSYLVFGPLLLTFVNYGFAHFKNIAFTCSLRGITHHVNFPNIAVLLFCFVLSLCLTFSMAITKTIDMAQQGFTDENSLIYRLTAFYFTF